MQLRAYAAHKVFTETHRLQDQSSGFQRSLLYRVYEIHFTEILDLSVFLKLVLIILQL
jgi:hypothetical protein